MMKHVSGDRIGTGMSFYMLGGELSRSLGPLIITAAVSLWGMDGTWRLMPFGIACSAVLYLKLGKIRIQRKSRAAKDSGLNIRKSLKSILKCFSLLLCFFFSEQQ